MKKILFFLSFLYLDLFSSQVVPGDEYISAKDKKIDLIVASEYEKLAPKIFGFEKKVFEKYEKLFGYMLDDKLYLIFASSNNQIANAFSTQFPLNMQVDYIGGSLMSDYFSTTSWFKTILSHESAHNFQLNAKKNPISAFLHKIVKNTPYTSLLFIPVFPVPNIFESSFILEGNAVLNESLFANGGRLYSGEALAMSVLQAKAGYITPQRVYNDHLFFPYKTHHYIVGGFFQLFLAQKYGLKKTNRYFLAYSDQWLPFFTNSVFKTHFGKNFEEELKEYNQWLLKKGESFIPTQAKKIVSSKSAISLSSDKKEIFFLITDKKSAPKLVRFDKKSGSFSFESGDYLFGKVFKIDGKFYTRSYAKTKKNKIEIALFNENGVVEKNSGGKVLQDILSDKKELYFAVKSSFDEPKLYKDGKYLYKVNSSVITDSGEDIYYFRQKGKKRTLYKNEKALFSFNGYYSKAVDIDSKKRVLFISNSSSGTTLYRYDPNSGIQRVLDSDDVIDAKLIDDENLLVEVIRADKIEMLQTKISPKNQSPFEVSYFFESEDNKSIEMKTYKTHKYKPIKNLRYSSLNQFVELNENNEIDFNLRATFADPLEQNYFSLFLSRLNNKTIMGTGYLNEQNLANFYIDLYAVLEEEKSVKSRGVGFNGYLKYPLYKNVYKSADFKIGYHLDSNKDERSPLSIALSFSDTKRFGYSFYPNDKNALKIYGVNDREDYIFGAKYNFSKGFDREVFLKALFEYSKSDLKDLDAKKSRGVWVDDAKISGIDDPSRIVMGSLVNDIYVKDVLKCGVGISKVFNASAYFYSFPLSLRREALYTKYSYYNLGVKNGRLNIDEYTLGLTLELLLMHKSVVNVDFEFLFNDDYSPVNRFKMIIDASF